MPYILTTPRLAFREMTRDDLPFLAAMTGDSEVMRYFPEALRRQGPRREVTFHGLRHILFGLAE